MTAAYLLHLSAEDGYDPTRYRLLVDEIAYRFIEDGGEIPAKVLADAALHCDITYINEALAKARDWPHCGEDEHVYIRALLMTPSSFDGQVCDADDINALVAFVIQHNLTLEEAWYNANEDQFGAIDWYEIRDNHLTKIARAVTR